MKIQDKLKKDEKKIVENSYKIALFKQDIALNIVDSLSTVFAREAPKAFSKEELADKVFAQVKKIPNSKVQEIIDADAEEKPKLRLRIEKTIIRELRKKPES